MRDVMYCLSNHAFRDQTAMGAPRITKRVYADTPRIYGGTMLP
jgi:hypothetical protein